MAKRIKYSIIPVTELHRQLGKVIRKVALSDEHFVVEKAGLPIAVMMSMKEYERLVIDWRLKELERLSRALGEEAERQELAEEQLMAELEEDRRAIYEEIYGEEPA